MENEKDILNKIKVLVLENSHSVILNSEEDYDRPMSEIGLDSLDTMTLFLEIQEQLGVKIPDEVIDELVSLRSLANYVNKNQN